MFELRPLIKEKDPAQIAREKSQPEIKKEYHRQTMEVLLEVAEKVLWENPNLGQPEIVARILTEARKLGAKASEMQKSWIEAGVNDWISDVGDEIEAIRVLYTSSEEFMRASATGDYVVDQSPEPWKLLKDDDILQKSFLRFLPVISKDPKDYIFHADRPPFVIVECLRDEDYQTLSPYDEIANSTTVGLAHKTPVMVMHEGWDKRLFVFNRKLGFIKAGVGQDVVDHELQHLFYSRYVVGRKMRDWRALDELAAYAKHGEYCLNPGGIFSDKMFDPDKIFREHYSPDWRQVMNELLRLKYFDVPAKTLWPIISVSENLADLSDRLKLIDTSKEEFDENRIFSEDFEWWWLFKNTKVIPVSVLLSLIRNPEIVHQKAEDYVSPFQVVELEAYLERSLSSNYLRMEPIIVILDELQAIFDGLVQLGFEDNQSFVHASRVEDREKIKILPIEIDKEVFAKIQEVVNRRFSPIIIKNLILPLDFSDNFSEISAQLRNWVSTIQQMQEMQDGYLHLSLGHKITEDDFTKLLKVYCRHEDFYTLPIDKRLEIIKKVCVKAARVNEQYDDLYGKALGLKYELALNGRNDLIRSDDPISTETGNIFEKYNRIKKYYNKLVAIQQELI